MKKSVITKKATILKTVKLNETLSCLHLVIKFSEAFRIKNLVLSYKEKSGDLLYIRVLSLN